MLGISYSYFKKCCQHQKNDQAETGEVYFIFGTFKPIH